MDGRPGRQECSLPEGTGAQISSFIKHASRFRDAEEKALGTRIPSVCEEHHTELSSDWPGSEWTATFGGEFETVGLRAQRQGGEFRIPNVEFRRPLPPWQRTHASWGFGADLRRKPEATQKLEFHRVPTASASQAARGERGRSLILTTFGMSLPGKEFDG